MENLIFIAIWIAILTFNAVYNLLPSHYQSKKWLRLAAICAAMFILIYGVNEIINKHNSKIYAKISGAGDVITSKNFPWKIVREKPGNGIFVFMIEGLYVDVSQIEVVDINKKKYEKYNSWGGVAIKFNLPEDKMHDFRLQIKNSL